MTRSDHARPQSVLRLALPVLVLLAVAGTSDAEAQERDSRWTVRGELMFMIAAGGDEAGCPDRFPEVEGEITGDTFEQDIDHGPGGALGIEYLVGRKIGIEAAYVAGAFDGAFTISTPGLTEKDSGDIDFTAFTLGANYHFRPAKRFDYFAGLFYTYYEYHDLMLQYPGHGVTVHWTFGGPEGKQESDQGWGFRLGMDVPFKPESPWTFVAGVRHFRGPIDIHPVDVTVGIGRRF